MYISNAQAKEVLTVLQKNQIPLHLGVALLCKAKGVTLSELAAGAGRHRSYLHQTLTGVFSPAEDFRNHITRKLGIDPWQFGPGIDSSESNTEHINR
jgi:transcriptional regulator with XRE-family HTH domain